MKNKHFVVTEMTEEDKIRYYDNEFFHTGTNIIAKRLKLDVNTLDQITVIHDILARTYLNAIDDRGLVIDTVPFFFLYLPARVDFSEKELSLTNRIDEYTYDYVKAYFVMSIEGLLEELHHLAKGVKRFKEVALEKEEDVDWVIQYLENRLIKDRPDWWKLLDANRIRIEVTEPLLMKTLGPDVGTELLIYRPYTLQSRRNRWDIEKRAVFVKSNRLNNGPFYLDYARIKVTHKTVGSYGMVSIIAKDEHGDNFVCDIPPDTRPEDVLCQWRVFINLGIMEGTYSEEQIFVSISDFERINKRCGYPLTEFKLKTLVEDASMKTIHLKD